jgi:predicted AlkP superfamily phosphohydrolase/phosphomutase
MVFALDGVAFPYLDAFDLPNLEALRSRGVEAPLGSTHPPWTASAWPSMYTGTDPSHHGVFTFFDFEGTYPDEADVVDRTDVRRPALWNYLSDDGLPSIVLNVPVTHPAEPIEGALIPGYLAPEEAAGHPKGVRADVSDALGAEYRIYAESELSDDPAEKLDGYVDLIDLRARAAEYFLSSREWSLAVVQVQKTDAVFHNFDDPAAWERVYAAADRLVGRVLDAVDGEPNVVVCSDHGMKSRSGQVIYVNEVLREHGFVEATSEAEREGPSLEDRKRNLIDGDPDPNGKSTLAGRAVSGVAAALEAVGISPGNVYGALERAGLGRAALELLPEDANVGERVDWRASEAYCRLGTEMGVRINLAGREPDGVVPPSKYDQVRDRIIEVLSDLQTPADEPAFEFVEPRERIYDGPNAERAPDVVFRPAEMNHGVVAGLVGQRFIPTDQHNHDVDGVFVGAGPGFDPDGAVDGLSLVDVAPIVMALLGRPVPRRMTSRVPPEVLAVDVDYGVYDGVEFATASDEPAEDDQVEERLEDLGYL